MKSRPKDVREIEINNVNWRRLVPRLLKIAYYYAKRYNVGDDINSVAQDAVQSAVLKTLAGERKWNEEEVDLFHFLAATIRSLVSNEARKRQFISDQATMENAHLIVADSSASVEATSHLASYIRYLSKERPDLIPILNELLSGEHATQANAAKQLGLSPSVLSKKRAQLVELAERFKKTNVEIDYVSTAKTTE